MTKKGKARQGRSRKRIRGVVSHSNVRVKYNDTASAPGDALTFAVPGVGVVDAKGKMVPSRVPPEPEPMVTGSHLRPKVDGEVRVPKHAFVVLSDAERATLLHPDDCPGCATPGWVQAHGWPLPCRCWTAPTPVDGSGRSERKWEGGDPVSVQEYEGEPAKFHRYFCPFFDHYPSAIPF